MTLGGDVTTLVGVEPDTTRGTTMASARLRLATLLPLALLAACTSATDRLNDGIALQSQGRYIEAVYRYADAVERDRELIEAQDRLLATGDSAVSTGMDDADDLERRGDPVQAAALYHRLDQMLARVRQVGLRINVPGDYSAIRRAVFDTAINWQMVRGDEAVQDGRWADARRFYLNARGDYLPSRVQVEESYDGETRVLLQWAQIELEDLRPRSAFGLAQEALEVRGSPSRETVLAVRDLQDRALAEGSVVVAVLPVTGSPGVRDFLGGEFEIRLDEDLGVDHWTQPPLFIEMADPLILRNELRGLLRGQVAQTPLVVGRALDLIGADLGVLIRLTGIEVVEEDVDVDEHETIVERNVRRAMPQAGGDGRARGRGQDQGRGRARGRSQGEEGVEVVDAEVVLDTVTYTTHRGDLVYFVEAEITLVDTSGREVNRFSASSRQGGPFERGEFDGDPSVLALEGNRARFFDPSVLATQIADIEGRIMEELALTIAGGTYDQVLSGIN